MLLLLSVEFTEGYGSGESRLLLDLLEFGFGRTAGWADPVLRQILEGRPRVYSRNWVAISRIIHVPADLTDPFVQGGLTADRIPRILIFFARRDSGTKSKIDQSLWVQTIHP